MKRRRIILVAISASLPGTMGGNTKITLEMARNLQKFGWEVVVIVPEEKLATFTQNIGYPVGVEYATFNDFSAGIFRRPLSSAVYYYRRLKEKFAKLDVNPDDVVYSNCNFHYEIVAMSLLKRCFHYFYLPSHYLFSPFIIENLTRGYRFPAFKYLIVWFYERFFFLCAKRFADGFVITNDSDRRHFGQSFQKRIIAIYGGVNVEQIPKRTFAKNRDVVFCSRLHPQKGVEGLLDIWSYVVAELPGAKLSIIGNGDVNYEQLLHEKAARLGIDESLEWLGYVNNNDKYNIYASARVFVHPTVFDNNGMVAAEALCSGLPVVMYDLPSLRSVYETGCVKIPYGDKKSFANAIIRLLKNDEYCASTAPSAEEICELRKYWNWMNRARIMSDFLESAGG